MSVWEELKTQWRTSEAMKRILLVNLGVFIAVQLVGLLSGSHALYERTWRGLSASTSWQGIAQRPWSVITYMFLHTAVPHILWNMVVFWTSGLLFENLLGGRRLVANYLLGGMAGLLLCLVAGPWTGWLSGDVDGPVLGASGAVMSVLVGVTAYQPDLPVNVLLIRAVPIKWVTIVLLVLDLVAIRGGDNTGGHLTHIGGALYGFLSANQMKHGRDWNLAVGNALARLGSLFSGKRTGRMRVAKRPRSHVLADEQYNVARRDRQARVDAILDKISKSGYDSLSREEREFLFRASKDK